MREKSAKDLLLDQVVDHFVTDGLGDLSLRKVAAAIGTSHRMLLYHFGSREGLLLAVTDAVETAKHNARDAASEAQHHAAARAEAEKRSGDSLSPGEQAQSLATEVREEALAKVDSVRQEIRKNL